MNSPPEELLSAYLDGELTAEEQAQVERLLAGSAEARQLLEELRLLSQSLQSLPMHQVREDLTAKVFQEVQRRKAETPAEVASLPLPVCEGTQPAPATPVPREVAASLPKQAPAPLTGPAPSAACPRAAKTKAGPPASAQPADDLLAGTAPKEAPGWQWAALVRRLLTSRGLIWSAIAVLVAGLIWWFGPAGTRSLRHIALAPPSSFPDRQEAEQKPPPRTGPTGAAVRARSADEPPLTSEEKHALLADSQQKPPEDGRPSADRAFQRRQESGSEAFRQGAPKAASGEPAMLRSAAPSAPALEKLEEKELSRGSRASALEGPSKASASRDQGFGGAAPPGPQAGASPEVAKTPPSADVPAAGQSSALSAMKAERGNRSGETLPGHRDMGVQPPPASAPSPETPSLLALQDKVLRKGPEIPPSAKAPLMEGKGSGPSAAVAKTQPPPNELNNILADRLTRTPLPADPTLVVVCDLTATALRQQAFEQILSSQQIALVEADEDVLEELQADSHALRGPQTDPGFAMPGKPVETDGAHKPKPITRPSKDLWERAVERAKHPTETHPAPSKIAKAEARPDRTEQIGVPSLPKPGPFPSNFPEPLCQTQLHFILVEASPAQVEGTLRALQARPEEFLAVSVSPAPADPGQQIYQQYNRAYRDPGLTPPGDQPTPAGLTPFKGQTLQADQSPSLRRSATGEPVQPGDAGSALAKAPGPSEHSTTSPPGESAQQKTLPQKGQATTPGWSPPSGSAARATPAPETPRQQAPVQGQQQAWARRLRLPEHLRQQLAFQAQALSQSKVRAEAADATSDSEQMFAQPTEHPPALLDEQQVQMVPPSQGRPAAAGPPSAPPPSEPSMESQPVPSAGSWQFSPAAKPLKPSAKTKPVPSNWKPSETPLPEETSSAKPKSAKPTMPLEQAHPDSRQKADAQSILGLPTPAEEPSLPQRAPQAQRLRVLFVLRLAEPSP